MTKTQIFVFIALLLTTSSAKGLTTIQDTAIKVSADSIRSANRPLKSYSVGIDVAGLAMCGFASEGQCQIAARVNLYDKFFPLIEMGMGLANHTFKDTQIYYKTQSPYIRLGADFNFLSHDPNKNRLYSGLRIAYSDYSYDVSAPTLHDPVYNTNTTIDFKNIGGKQLWGELVMGIETRIWKKIRVGWDVRYKYRFSEKSPSLDGAGYVPGYGRHGKKCFGGQLNLIFEFY